MSSLRVIFFGTPPFAADILEFLLNNKINVVAVISKPDKPKGRSSTPVPTPVKAAVLALDPKIPIYQPEIVSAPEFSSTLSAYQPDLFIVVGYGEIIKQHLLDMPRLGCINVHVSLLPKYRGAAPIQRCVINGDSETGVTIMHMVKKMDAGDIIEVAKVPIDHEATFGEVEKMLGEAAKPLLLKVLHDFEAGIIKRIPQDHDQATLAPKIELEDCEIYWEEPAERLHNLIRGVNPYPGAWCYVSVKGIKKRLKIMRTRVIDQQSVPGTILSNPKQNLVVAARQGALELLEVQLEGKKIMTSEELIRGIPLHDLAFQL